MLNRKAVFDESSMEATLSFQQQDNEFCRRLLAAIHLGRKSCPVGVITQPGTKRPITNYQRLVTAVFPTSKLCSKRCPPNRVKRGTASGKPMISKGSIRPEFAKNALKASRQGRLSDGPNRLPVGEVTSPGRTKGGNDRSSLWQMMP
jgi:hypothetical protein